MVEKISELISNLKENEVLEEVRKEIESGIEPIKILDSLKDGMLSIGERWKEGEYFVPEVIMGAEISKQIMEILKPELERSRTKIPVKGCVVIGTVKGDIHNIGKNITSALLQAAGFDVLNLGEDVPSEAFIEKVKEVKPNVVGLSGLLTLAVESMKETIEKLKEAGLREQLKIIIGGPFLTEKTREYVGADAFTHSATEGIEKIKSWIGV